MNAMLHPFPFPLGNFRATGKRSGSYSPNCYPKLFILTTAWSLFNIQGVEWQSSSPSPQIIPNLFSFLLSKMCSYESWWLWEGGWNAAVGVSGVKLPREKLHMPFGHTCFYPSHTRTQSSLSWVTIPNSQEREFMPQGGVLVHSWCTQLGQGGGPGVISLLGGWNSRCLMRGADSWPCCTATFPF